MALKDKVRILVALFSRVT